MEKLNAVGVGTAKTERKNIRFTKEEDYLLKKNSKFRNMTQTAYLAYLIMKDDMNDKAYDPNVILKNVIKYRTNTIEERQEIEKLMDDVKLSISKLRSANLDSEREILLQSMNNIFSAYCARCAVLDKLILTDLKRMPICEERVVNAMGGKHEHI